MSIAEARSAIDPEGQVFMRGCALARTAGVDGRVRCDMGIESGSRRWMD